MRSFPLRRVLRKASDPLYEAKRRGRLRIARIWRQRCKDTIFIGITGSHGKTTATSLLGAILDRKASTHLSVLDNQTKAVARAILRTSPKAHRYAVLEVSGDEPGAVEKSAGCLLPDVGIVTAVGGDHRKAFGGSQEATAAEKAKLVQAIPADGLAILNADDPLVIQMRGKCRCRVVTFGRAENADLRLLDAVSDWPDRLNLNVEYRGERISINTQLVGTHWSVSVMAALLAALELGVPKADCVDAISAFEPAFGRMSVHSTPNQGFYVLDTSKASYSGIETCLAFLEKVTAPRRTVVMGNISDHHGSDRPRYHEVARAALRVAERVIFTGPNASRVRRLETEFPGRLFHIESREDAAKAILGDLAHGEVVYVKAPATEHLYRFFVPEPQR